MVKRVDAHDLGVQTSNFLPICLSLVTDKFMTNSGHPPDMDLRLKVGNGPGIIENNH